MIQYPGLVQCNFGESDIDSNHIVDFENISSHSQSPPTNPSILYEADVSRSKTDSDFPQPSQLVKTKRR